MRLVVITGGIACGKSTVTNYLIEKHSIKVLDSDQIVRDLQQPNTPIFRKLVETFGSGIVAKDGSLDRVKLGEIVFNNRDERRKIDKIVHPAVFKELLKQLLKSWIRGDTIVVVDIPLFFEARLPRFLFSDIVTVAISPEEQKKRLMLRNSFTEKEAEERIQAQMPLEDKCRLSSIVIRNEGTVTDLQKQVDDVVKKWKHEIYFSWFPNRWLVLTALICAFFMKRSKF